MEMEVDTRPDKILLYKEGADILAYHPFTYDEETKTVKVLLKTDDEVSVLPIVSPPEPENIEEYYKNLGVEPEPDEEETNTEEEGEATQTRLGNLDTSLRPFQIVINDGQNLNIDIAGSLYKEWYLRKERFNVRVFGQEFGENSNINISNAVNGSYNVEMIMHYKVLRSSKWKQRVVWSQNVYIQGKNYIAETIEQERAELAKKYAPVLVLNKSEEYYPATLDYVFNKESTDNSLSGEKFRVNTLLDWGGKAFDFRDIDKVLPYYGHKDAIMDIGVTGLFSTTVNSTNMRKRFNRNNPTVYYSWIKGIDLTNQENIYFINYHFLYPFDPKSGTSSDPSIFGHIFDRESVTVVLDKNKIPQYVVYGAHLKGQPIDYKGGVLAYKNWFSGRVKIGWSTTEKFRVNKTHPVVYMAQGAHACYPIPGTYGVYYIAAEEVGQPAVDEKTLVNNYNADKILFPDMINGNGIVKYSLRDIEIGKISSFSFNRYLAFSGYMVDILHPAKNEHFPPFTDREVNPYDYYSYAYAFNMNEIGENTAKYLEKFNKFLVDKSVR